MGMTILVLSGHTRSSEICLPIRSTLCGNAKSIGVSRLSVTVFTDTSTIQMPCMQYQHSLPRVLMTGLKVHLAQESCPFFQTLAQPLIALKKRYLVPFYLCLLSQGLFLFKNLEASSIAKLSTVAE